MKKKTFGSITRGTHVSRQIMGRDLSLKDEDVRDNETYIKDNDSKFGGN